MGLIVHKYGGTSVGTAERIQAVARRVAKWKSAGHQVVVVVSAMSGETNRLIGLAKQIQPEASRILITAAGARPPGALQTGSRPCPVISRKR